MRVNPITSDGNWTIGYNDEGVAGEWSGNMSEFCESFAKVNLDTTWCDGNEEWMVVERQDGTLCWQDSNDAIYEPEDFVQRRVD